MFGEKSPLNPDEMRKNPNEWSILEEDQGEVQADEGAEAETQAADSAEQPAEETNYEAFTQSGDPQYDFDASYVEDPGRTIAESEWDLSDLPTSFHRMNPTELKAAIVKILSAREFLATQGKTPMSILCAYDRSGNGVENISGIMGHDCLLELVGDAIDEGTTPEEVEYLMGYLDSTILTATHSPSHEDTVQRELHSKVDFELAKSVIEHAGRDFLQKGDPGAGRRVLEFLMREANPSQDRLRIRDDEAAEEARFLRCRKNSDERRLAIIDKFMPEAAVPMLERMSAGYSIGLEGAGGREAVEARPAETVPYLMQDYSREGRKAIATETIRRMSDEDSQEVFGRLAETMSQEQLQAAIRALTAKLSPESTSAISREIDEVNLENSMESAGL